MAELTSYGSSGKGSTEDNTIDDAVVNNGLKCYYLELSFSVGLVPEYVVIEYEYTTIDEGTISEQSHNIVITNNQ
ncbi:hypothetical protein AYK25_05700 [Thermoplasmatales archaeon SM1-50]|nr:MAG: hypothetical protein AYK25_05700 [Thermoplasmatales archaeon SM1-50]